MNAYTGGPHEADSHIGIPFTLLAAAPSLQGICLWGQRTGSAEPYIEWLLSQLAARRPPMGQRQESTPSQRHQRLASREQPTPSQGCQRSDLSRQPTPSQPRRRMRPVRLPANATPSSVSLISAHGDSLLGCVSAAEALSTSSTTVPNVFFPTAIPLLERARGGVLIIESADLVPKATAAALVRSLARMPAHERPLLIARSEQHPSRWRLLADQCAFWVREPRSPGHLSPEQTGLMYVNVGPEEVVTTGEVAGVHGWTGSDELASAPKMTASGVAAIDTKAMDAASFGMLTLVGAGELTAAALRFESIELAPDILRRMISRIDKLGPDIAGNVHGVDLFLARAARAVAALQGAVEVEPHHIDTAWQLVVAPRLAGENPRDPMHRPDPSDWANDPTGRGPYRVRSTPNLTRTTGAQRPVSAVSLSGQTPTPDKTVGRPARPSGSTSAANEPFTDRRVTGHRDPTSSDDHTVSNSPTDASGTPGPEAHGDDLAGGRSSRLIVVPPAALFSALALPAAHPDRRKRVTRAQLGGAGKRMGIAPGYIPGQPVALVSTLQAAIPWQRLRQPPSGRSAGPMLQVRPEDLRIHRRQRRPKVLYIIAVDGSGSMARGRMQLAKGAALAVLAGAYKERRFVSLIDFRNDKATLMCPPGRSSAAIRRLITTMPSGGGTPLPAALVLARDVARHWLHNNPTGKVKLILFTDGKANVPLQAERSTNPAVQRQTEPHGANPLDHSTDTISDVHLSASLARRAAARRDIVEVAAHLRDSGVSIRLVDTDGWRPSPELLDLAELLNAPIIRTARRSPRR